jgi:hypothetical protein
MCVLLLIEKSGAYTGCPESKAFTYSIKANFKSIIFDIKS